MRATILMLLLSTAGMLTAAEVVELDATQMERAGVTVGEVVEHSFGDRQQVVGQVVRVPGSTLTLKTLIGGRVESIAAAPGDRVEAGDVIATLHSHEILGLQSDLLRARERAKLADTRAEAARQLFEVEGISRIELEQREQESFAADLDYQMFREELLDHGFPEAALDRVLETRSTDPHLPVAAPTSGVVLELGAEEHEWVEAYQVLVVIGDPDRLEVEFQLSLDQAAVIEPGDEISFFPAGRPSSPGRAVAIQRVPQVDPGSRTIKLRARIEEAGAWLYPGVFVEGTVTSGDPRSGPSVPTQAVINLAGRDTVFVHRQGGAFEARSVVLGASDGDFFEVVSGVGPGDRIATGGVFLLKSTLVGGGGEEE
ncbi:MAG: efflux RND transporter periplasmic adaptor subunit [Thermoanaerobaculales bacterium]|jgi:cobalt-zinc-cadmium efflux system membrane fusion protein|nr:efflux RND transporter periplasmic adaptor subunit [Thermoanaerobaculales bacterium]